MKILIYENSSGFTSYTYKLCNYLSTLDLKVTYLTSENNNEVLSISENVVLLQKLKNFDSSYRKGSFRWLFERLSKARKNIIFRNRLVKKEKYDVVCIQETIPVLDRFYIKKISKYSKVVLTVHDIIPPIKSKSYSTKALRKIYKSVDALVVHSEKNKEQLVNLFSVDINKIYVIPHGVEKTFNKINQDLCKKKFDLEPDKNTILFYGLIREQKGLDNLLNALKDINDYQLLIAGGMPHGESFEKYHKIISEYKINAKELIHYIPNEWNDYLFQAADLIVLPYKYFYSQSGVLMQSIQYRKPVIVSNVGALTEVVRDFGIGYIVEPNNVDKLRESIITIQKVLKNNPNYFLNNLEKAASEYSWESSAKKYFNVFLLTAGIN